jgi:sugar phosphate isomerase/epimerase
MRLGYVTRATEEVVKFASKTGFDGLEVAFGAWGGPEFDLRMENAKRVKGLLEENGLKALTLHFIQNYAEESEPVLSITKALDMAAYLGTKILTINAWIPGDLKVDEKFDYYKKVWTGFAKVAEDKGMKIAIENCPHGGHNLGNCPAAFRRMFDLVPSKTIGIEFDPSHFIFQLMDYLPAIREFGDRIYAFHAKDTQILTDKLNSLGIYGDQYFNDNWWRFRMPGYGDADWKKIFVALSDIKYDGDIIIEHEDPTYEGEEGLRRGYKFLKQYIL